MSFSAVRESKHVRRACQSCHDRKARFRYAGQVKSDRDHVLCFECFRRERNRRDAVARASLTPLQRMAATSPFRGIELTERQVEHRRRMLQHMAALVTACP